MFFNTFIYTLLSPLGIFALVGGAVFLEKPALLAQSNPKKSFAGQAKRASVLDKGSFELRTGQKAVLGKYPFHKLDSNQLFIQTDPLTGRITNPEIFDDLKKYTIIDLP
jgi:hypothetical protein